MAVSPLRPLEHLQTLSKRYPDAWKQVEIFLVDRGTTVPDWPSWCFLPMAAWYSMVSAAHEVARITAPAQIIDVGRLAALGSWRYTQGIYRLDPDLAAAVAATPLTGDLPVEVLHYLPEWCVYLETPGMIWLGGPLYGFWAHLEWDANTGREELRLVLDTERALLPVVLHLGPWPLLEAITRTSAEASRQAEGQGLKPFVQEAKTDTALQEQLTPLISLLLYLCSAEPEIMGQGGSTPALPQLKRTRKGLRLFPPDKPRIWMIGTQVGETLRRAAAEIHHEGHAIRPHLRRAHWHGYWHGHGVDKRFQFQWLAPIVVRGRIAENAGERNDNAV